MTTINTHETKTHFSQIIKRVLAGEEIVVAKSGKPLVRIIPYEETEKKRAPGQLKGMITIEDNFDDPLPSDIMKAFE